jgi:hypothetical protein
MALGQPRSYLFESEDEYLLAIASNFNIYIYKFKMGSESISDIQY